MKKILILLIFFIVSVTIYAQDTYPVNGIDFKNNNYYAFKNAVLHVDYKTIIQDAILLIRSGKIINAGKDIDLPKGTVEYDLNGLHIYPSMIDIFSTYGIPEAKREQRERGPQMLSKKSGAYAWNEAVKPESNASEMFSVNSKDAEKLRELGFGAVLTSKQDGIVRGTAAFVLLGDDSDNESVIRGKAAALYSFSKGTSTQDYPGSLMGSIALLKQTYLDAEWYNKAGSNADYNISLEAFNKNKSLTGIFEVGDWQEVLRADKIGDEFGSNYIFKTGGDSYKRIDEIKATGSPLIVPVDFPDAYDVEDPYDAMLVGIDDLKHWEMAPANSSFLEKAGIDFAFTPHRLKKNTDFIKNIRKAIEYGLSKETALKALTFNPASFLDMSEKIGTLEKGKIANFIITSGDLFEEGTEIHQNWIAGKPYFLKPIQEIDIRGSYSLSIGNNKYELVITGAKEKPKAEIISDDTLKANISVNRNLVTISFENDNEKGRVRLSGNYNTVSKEMDGNGQLELGEWIKWSADLTKSFEEKDKNDKKKTETHEIGEVIYPFQAFGKTNISSNNDVLIKNATVWTNEKEGILKNTDVLIVDGKIKEIGQGLSSGGAKEIDGTGKHLTSGIIDEHSHIAISRGVNEAGLASSAEVSIGDVVNSEDINIYRQLAGGVTAIQQLHGSANPIGGQSSIIKLRWGKTPEEMKIKGADKYIKFALGENVKQSNWGSDQTTRYPQTRMGVEQFYIEKFTRAKEYEKAMNDYNSLSSSEKKNAVPPRRDLELETLLEIINKERFITCHSYVQSEIVMLMRVAEMFGFKVNTFTHILEGYKTADKMKEHGAGGSTFSDWWAYKFEVRDAIPYNGTIMHKVGVITAFNSDDAEMARRLNQEAGKAVKYGGVTEEEALKFVTLNPAKLLHLEDRMGSIKIGKDGDVVLWSDNPLSIYAKAEKTIIDGIIYYDFEEDLKMREELNTERTRLINKMIDAKNGGAKTKKPAKKAQLEYHCDTIIDFGK